MNALGKCEGRVVLSVYKIEDDDDLYACLPKLRNVITGYFRLPAYFTLVGSLR